MRLVFLGPPGAGKGTYSSRVGKLKGFAHISTGDILRSEVKNSTELGTKAKEYMDKGQLVPDDLVIGMLKERLEQDDCEKGFILDGFPRTINQAEELGKITEVDAAVNLVIPDWVLIEKILARRTCEKCGAVYNVADIRFGPDNSYHMPPMNPKQEGICDECGGRLVSRSDETKEIIQDRLKEYKEKTQPLIDYYREKGLLKDVDVIGPPEVMVPRIMEVLGI